jgi:hypothetical protein
MKTIRAARLEHYGGGTPAKSIRSPAMLRSSAVARAAKPMNGINAPQRPDCVAGQVRLELRNVAANYPFESLQRFPGIRPNSDRRDHSRVSCGAFAAFDPVQKKTRNAATMTWGFCGGAFAETRA